MSERRAAASPCRVQRSCPGDLDVLVIGNGRLQLAFLPQVGGRLISLSVDGAEVLWRNPAYLSAELSPVVPHATWPEPDGTMASWANVGGGKTWPAPQGWSGPDAWPGPPDPVLDAGPYKTTATVNDDGAAMVTLTSAIDRRTGLQVTREFLVPPAGTSFSQASTFVNHSDRTVRWAVWEVVQVETAPMPGLVDRGAFLVQVDNPEPPLALFEVAGRAAYEVTEDALRVPVQDVVGKLGFAAATGRVEFARADGLRLALTVERQPQDYPDGGCPVELWLQYPLGRPLPELGGLAPDAHLVEMEVLSPLVTLSPGEATRLDTTWECSIPHQPA